MAFTFRKRPGLKQPKEPRPPARHVAGLDIPVPAAQRVAERASGPQQAYAPRPGTGPQPQAPRASGPHPALNLESDPYPTQPLGSPVAPEEAMFAGQPQAPGLPRRYAPQNTPPAPVAVPEPPRPPEPSPIGDALNAEWQTARRWEHEVSDQTRLARQRARSLTYPRRDLNAAFHDYAALMRRVDGITGTRGTDLWPLPAIEGGDAA